MTIACTFFTRFRLLMPRAFSSYAHVSAAQITRNFIAMDNEIKLSLTFLCPPINQPVFSQPNSVFLTLEFLQCTIELFNLKTQPFISTYQFCAKLKIELIIYTTENWGDFKAKFSFYSLRQLHSTLDFMMRKLHFDIVQGLVAR